MTVWKLEHVLCKTHAHINTETYTHYLCLLLYVEAGLQLSVKMFQTNNKNATQVIKISLHLLSTRQIKINKDYKWQKLCQTFESIELSLSGQLRP